MAHGILKAVIPTMDSMKTNDQELSAKSIDMISNDEEIESEEEIITQSIPPTEIVDTVVTTTTNPDGSLKRTTRKTTRTLMTTTRVRRIKTKSPVANDVRNPDLETESTEEIPEVNGQPPTLYTVIGPREHSQDDKGESRITQATFTFLPPTTRTEVTYEESDRDVSEIDPEAVKHLKQLRSDSKAGETIDLQSNTTDSADASEQSKARTKTTVRKTVTASAATATFVATGKPKNIPGSLSNLQEGTMETNNPETMQPSTDAFSLIRKFGRPELNTDAGTSALSSEQEVSQNVPGATTVTKRTTRVVNNLASKRTSLESLKKPFTLWSKELRHDDTTSRIPEEQSTKVSGSSTIEPVDTEQLALLTLKESERLFSEAKMLIPAQDEFDNAQKEQIFMQPSSSLQSESSPISEVRFHSRFANLPLYQGYGLIAQQLALCKQQQLRLQQESQNEPVESIGSVSAFTTTTSTNTTTTTTTTVKSPEPSTTFTNAAEWFGQTNGEFGPGIELNLATNALVSLLDESTERFLEEAAKQWYRIGCTSFELPGKITQSNLGIPETKKSISWSEQLSEGKADETVSICFSFITNIAKLFKFNRCL
ncbi:hypothetical protein EG68_05728 [Paragonimus skrjabini miyazakii]|uniref:Uncharacterized protein n=1 Tax=Paragonimus skrjabini miyazakii TaxID=59628 RepID=A0A8S9YB62_9TREM|nr:hypothetical protein EG68_05728 [Paragonimus skrjabini miyazakii]